MMSNESRVSKYSKTYFGVIAELDEQSKYLKNISLYA